MRRLPTLPWVGCQYEEEEGRGRGTLFSTFLSLALHAIEIHHVLAITSHLCAPRRSGQELWPVGQFLIRNWPRRTSVRRGAAGRSSGLF